MPQQGRQGRDHQDQRQDAQCEDEQRPGIGHLIGLVAAAHVAENKLHALAGGIGQGIHAGADTVEDDVRLGNGEQDQDQHDLDGDGAQGQEYRKARLVFRQQPAKTEDDGNPEQALQVFRTIVKGHVRFSKNSKPRLFSWD